MTYGFIDFIITCDWCGRQTDKLTTVQDPYTGGYYYLCKNCMKEVRKIRKERKNDGN